MHQLPVIHQVKRKKKKIIRQVSFYFFLSEKDHDSFAHTLGAWLNVTLPPVFRAKYDAILSV